MASDILESGTVTVVSGTYFNSELPAPAPAIREMKDGKVNGNIPFIYFTDP